MPGSGETGPARVRVDKWLWAARFFKTRALAAEAVRSGRVELNGSRTKPAHGVVAGDRLTVRKSPFVFHVEVTLASPRRVSPSGVADMYTETEGSRETRMAVSERLRAEAAVNAVHSKGRPTKRDRRQIVRFRRQGGS